MFVGYSVLSPASSIEVSVVIDGVTAALYRSAVGALYVAGTPGSKYVLNVRNVLHESRVEVINSVDGRNTLKDEPGDTRANTGLVFNMACSGAFSGWRINDNETREFVFGSPARSVAARATGSTDNTGVIGFGVYRELAPSWSYQTLNKSVPYASAGLESYNATMAGGAMTRGLGTRIGEKRHDRVGHTTFNRDTNSLDVLVIGYDSYDSLFDQGIVGSQQPATPAGPCAFPGSGTGYENY